MNHGESRGDPAQGQGPPQRLILSHRSARILLPLGMIVAGGTTLFSRAVREPVTDRQPPAGWNVGLGSTPPYVPVWKRAKSVSAGKADGSIPANALEFETGNDGKAFGSLNDWLAACNSQDVPGAIETPIEVHDLPRTYIARGLYGAGPSDVKIKWTGRAGTTHHCWLYIFLEDVIVRGIDFDGFNVAIGVSYPTLPLKNEGGSIDPEPYHSSSEIVYRALKSSTGGPSDGLRCHRLGRIIIVDDNFIVRSVHVRRQIALNTNKANGSNHEYIDDLIWSTVLENIPLFSAADCSSRKEIVAAINENAKQTGYGALINANGDILLVSVSNETQAVAEIVVEGNVVIKCDVQTPSVDISYCTFTDTNLAFGAILDVSELGPVYFCKNDLPGTWGGVGAFATRWSELYFANNRWRDCWSKRATALGRISSALPAGSNMTAFNTACYMGTNSPVMMRYHSKGNIALVENNEVRDIESFNKNDTVNCAVLADVRNGWQNTPSKRIIRFAYNDVINCKGMKGSQDSNIIYGKLRGFSVIGNRFVDFGAPALLKDGKRVSSEGLALLFKNPGPYNSPVNGIDSEPSIIWGNQFINGSAGVAWVKLDEMLCPVVIEQNLFRNWRRDDADVDGRNAGIVRITSHQRAVRVQSNRFDGLRQQDIVVWPVISLWNLKTSDGRFDFEKFVIAGNEVVLNDPASRGESGLTIPIAKISLSSPNSAVVESLSRLVTGRNQLLSPRGITLSENMPLRYNKGAAFVAGSASALPHPFVADVALRRYGADEPR